MASDTPVQPSAAAIENVLPVPLPDSSETPKSTDMGSSTTAATPAGSGAKATKATKRRGAPTKFSDNQLQVLAGLRDTQYLPLYPNSKDMHKWLKNNLGKILKDAAFDGKLVITEEDTEANWQNRIRKFFTNARDKVKKQGDTQGGETTNKSSESQTIKRTSRSTMRLAVDTIQRCHAQIPDAKVLFKQMRKGDIEAEMTRGKTFDKAADDLWGDEEDKSKYEDAALTAQIENLERNQEDFILSMMEILNGCAQYGHIGKPVMQVFYMLPNCEGNRMAGSFTVKWDPTIPDMMEEREKEVTTMAELFSEWATNHVPTATISADSIIAKDEAGRLRFPPLDIEHSTLADVRKCVADYLQALGGISGYNTGLPFDLINEHPAAFYDVSKFALPRLHNPSDTDRSVHEIANYLVKTSGPQSKEPFELWSRDEIEKRLWEMGEQSDQRLLSPATACSPPLPSPTSPTYTHAPTPVSTPPKDTETERLREGDVGTEEQANSSDEACMRMLDDLIEGEKQLEQERQRSEDDGGEDQDMRECVEEDRRSGDGGEGKDMRECVEEDMRLGDGREGEAVPLPVEPEPSAEEEPGLGNKPTKKAGRVPPSRAPGRKRKAPDTNEEQTSIPARAAEPTNRTPRKPRASRPSLKRQDQLNEQASPEKRRQDKQFKKRVHPGNDGEEASTSKSTNKRRKRE